MVVLRFLVNPGRGCTTGSVLYKRENVNSCIRKQ